MKERNGSLIGEKGIASTVMNETAPVTSLSRLSQTASDLILLTCYPGLDLPDLKVSKIRQGEPH